MGRRDRGIDVARVTAPVTLVAYPARSHTAGTVPPGGGPVPISVGPPGRTIWSNQLSKAAWRVAPWCLLSDRGRAPPGGDVVARPSSSPDICSVLALVRSSSHNRC